jgi:penicillin-binding protein 2
MSTCPCAFRLDDEEQARIAVNRHRMPGVVVDAQLQRHYPYGALFAHALGYVGRINEQEAAQIDAADYRGTHHIGKIGVEKYYEDTLHGEVGYQTVETNAHGRVLRVLERFDPTPGEDLVLHLDFELQRVAHDALAGRRGAAVAIDPDTGGVLALVSTPSFDANLFVNGISSRDYRALRNSPDVPLFNRTVQGQYPPGSTVKPMVALAGLEEGLIDEDFTVPDPGWYRLPGDAAATATGSCVSAALDMPRRWICRWPRRILRRVFLRSRPAPDHRYHARSSGPLRPRRSAAASTRRRSARGPAVDALEAPRRSRQPWYPGETLSAGIGQGYMLATPLQLAVATGIVANRGVFREPRLVQWLDELCCRRRCVTRGGRAQTTGRRSSTACARSCTVNGARRAPSAAVSTTKSPARPARRR